MFVRLMTSASPLGRLRTTPQTPPFHAEGEVVADHVKRMLMILDAVAQGATLAVIEECARERDYLLEFHALEQSLKTHAAFLAAYAVCHDLAKADTARFDALPGSLGASEGFTSRTTEPASEGELARYDKLRRAYAASGSSQLMSDKYGIVVHCEHHARQGASDAYASTREAVLNELGVPLSQAKLLTELIRGHMDVISTLSQGPDPVKYKAWAAIAERAGLHLPVYLEMLPATLCLDAVLGSLLYKQGAYMVQIELLLHLFASERQAFPERHAAREEALRRGRKQAVVETLQEAGIDADSVFALLKTPLGPVRGQIMRQIHELIHNPRERHDFGEHTDDLRQRAARARDLLSARHLRLD